jgi:hypothetical protein
MDSQDDRRKDNQTRTLIEEALVFKDTVGRTAAVSFLVEHHVPPPVLQRVLMEPGAAGAGAGSAG